AGRCGGALARPYDNDGRESAHDGNRNQGADGAAPGKPASHNQYVPSSYRSPGQSGGLATRRARCCRLDAPGRTGGFKNCASLGFGPLSTQAKTDETPDTRRQTRQAAMKCKPEPDGRHSDAAAQLTAYAGPTIISRSPL